MTKLSVNLNGAAYIRNRRMALLHHHLTTPDLVSLAEIALSAGAHGITVHPRPDERHITANDLPLLRKQCTNGKELNMEGFPDARFLRLVEEIEPDQVTFVPDMPDQATSNHGWQVGFEEKRLQEALQLVTGMGKRSSVFIDTDEEQLRYHHAIGADRVEFYTGPFASEQNPYHLTAICEELAMLADTARALGIEMNAGHDLNQANLNLLVKTIPDLSEVSIGHAMMGDALKVGLGAAVRSYLRIL